VFSDDARETITRGKFLAEKKIFPEKLLLARGALHENF